MTAVGLPELLRRFSCPWDVREAAKLRVLFQRGVDEIHTGIRADKQRLAFA